MERRRAGVEWAEFLFEKTRNVLEMNDESSSTAMGMTWKSLRWFIEMAEMVNFTLCRFLVH